MVVAKSISITPVSTRLGHLDRLLCDALPQMKLWVLPAQRDEVIQGIPTGTTKYGHSYSPEGQVNPSTIHDQVMWRLVTYRRWQSPGDLEAVST